MTWMSEGSDRDQKPTTYRRDFTISGLERPKRITRREVDYRNSGEGGSGANHQQTEGEVLREVFQQGTVRRVRESSVESVWGGSASDTTETGDCWSPRTVERRTGILFEGVNQLRSQIQQIQMAKKEEMNMQELLKIMLEMNNRQEQDRQKREEDLRARELREKDERLQRERRMEEESRIRMEKMAEEARIREEEREERARVREEKRKVEAREREEERTVQAEERERKMVVALRKQGP